MKKNWNAVEILRHSRHDWLNKLQLIKGNLSLNRVDRVNDIIEEIIIDTKNETKLTNLRATQLAGLLMMFNWEEHYFILDYEIIGDGRDLSMFDGELASWCKKFFSTLNEAVKPFAENHLIVSIQTSAEDTRFFFDFSGIIEDTAKVINYITSHPQENLDSINILEYQVHNEEMMVTIQTK